jgi:hypothetical protein
MGGCITSAGPAHRRLWGFSVPYVCTTPVALVAFMSHFPSGNGQAAVNLDDRSRLVTAGRSCLTRSGDQWPGRLRCTKSVYAGQE